MSNKKISRNAPCPCGSGKKYKNCCYGKEFDWVEDEEGNIRKSIPISPELGKVWDELRQSFLEKHGREPGPDDLLFSDLPHGEVVEHMMVEDMKKAGIDPAIIYAFEQTGLLVTEENMNLISDQDLEEWDAAIEEYQAQNSEVEYPVGTIAYYGPDDKTTTKIAAAVVLDPTGKPLDLRRWVGTGILQNEKTQQELQQFFTAHGVKTVLVSDGNMGCPHEEGPDFPVGEDCPFCPFWRGKQGSNALF